MSRLRHVASGKAETAALAVLRRLRRPVDIGTRYFSEYLRIAAVTPTLTHTS